MEKPTLYDDARDRDDYNDRLHYELNQFTNKLTPLDQEHVKHIIDCAYHEGYLDGARFVDMVYQRIT